MTTRTLNPLPFGDLEPHRFEDLIRQLAYEFRRWKSLEATGRAGSDDGIDIRATELVPVEEPPAADEENETPEAASLLERVWIFQCKRERTLPPKKIRRVIKESLASLAAPPHGFILAVASDVSKDARDAFREEMVARGIEEFLIWAKGELEDLLFQPKNDRLLFAYFGISLQPRRRSLSTTLRSDIAKKKQLSAIIGEENRENGILVLLRDPSDERYPEQPGKSDAPARWRLCRAMHAKRPDYLMVMEHEYLAAKDGQGRWDAIFGHDVLMDKAERELSSLKAWSVEGRPQLDRSAYDFWNEYIDEGDRAHLRILRLVPLDRFLALDPLGDGYFPVPHILVEFSETNGPFSEIGGRRLKGLRDFGGNFDLDLSEGNRGHIFPDPLPIGTDPEPIHFDDTQQEPPPLSMASGDRLAVLLGKACERKGRFDFEEDAQSAAAREEQAAQKHNEFRKWRDEVAMPVFSSFVHQLRANGHRARVRARPLPSTGATESIELRITLQASDNYRPSGHVSVSMLEHSLGGLENGYLAASRTEFGSRRRADSSTASRRCPDD